MNYEDWSLETIDSMRTLLKQELFDFIRVNTSFSRTPSIAIRTHSCAVPVHSRAYLDIPCQNHRICLTRILCASHNLAVEALRRIRMPGNVSIDRADRLCRLCGIITGVVEAVHHALFCCKGHLRLLSLRREFYRNMPSVNESLLPDNSDDEAWNRIIVVWADVLSSAIPLARLAWHVTRLFYEHQIFVPVIPSLTLTSPAPILMLPSPINMDPDSDYSSEEEVLLTTESVER
jgi:hypothetical protein